MWLMDTVNDIPYLKGYGTWVNGGGREAAKFMGHL